ncbi:caspase-7-like [Ptychodera flava]|uniref:caspase-7-like n=1 Tax=Ptychodera flava TaxID=63121 RepID=UPI00396A63BA
MAEDGGFTDILERDGLESTVNGKGCAKGTDDVTDTAYNSGGDKQNTRNGTSGAGKTPSHKSQDSNTGEMTSADDVDAKFNLFGFSKKSKNKGKKMEVHSEQARQINQNPDEYYMSHRKRGRAIIINIENFNNNIESRQGTGVDAKNLRRTFSKLGFFVDIYDDLSVLEINDLLQKVANEDHSNSDCIAISILSHGDQDCIYGRDGPTTVDIITGYFKGDVCPSLAGKPKLFFIQACRGEKMDDGIVLKDDEVDGARHQRIPVQSDFLICYATVDGYYAWRNPANGSYFIQALCSVLDQCSVSMDLLQMMTRVVHKVAYDFQSNMQGLEKYSYMDKKKQVPSIVSMLTKDLYFTPKNTVVNRYTGAANFDGR